MDEASERESDYDMIEASEDTGCKVDGTEFTSRVEGCGLVLLKDGNSERHHQRELDSIAFRTAGETGSSSIR